MEPRKSKQGVTAMQNRTSTDGSVPQGHTVFNKEVIKSDE